MAAFDTDSIAVLEGAEVRQVADILAKAARNGRTVRLTVDGGLKVDSSNGAGWTYPLGRTADATGR